MQDFSAKNSFIIFWIVTIAVLAGAILIIAPFIPAILWATVFSILLYPFFEKLVKRGWNRTGAALTVTLVPALVLILPLAVGGSIAGIQVVSYAQQLIHGSQVSENPNQSALRIIGSELDKAVKPVLDQVGVQNVSMADVLEKNKSEIAQRITKPLTSGVQAFIITVVTLIIAMLTTFFMVRDAHNMRDTILDLIPLPKAETEKILTQIAVTVRSVFFAVVVVAGIQGLIALILYAALGLPGAITLALVTTLFCMIPMLGAPVIYVPLALSQFMQGHVWQGVTLLIVGFGVISNIDNFLRPIFIGQNTNLHPIPVFFALLGGVLVFGPVGLMVGPILLTLILAFVDILRLRQDSPAEPQPELEPQTE
jgi:predicted PurR-regulated permease PerM